MQSNISKNMIKAKNINKLEEEKIKAYELYCNLDNISKNEILVSIGIDLGIGLNIKKIPIEDIKELISLKILLIKHKNFLKNIC